MSTENRFNLIEEPWIPVADVGLVSLRQVFQNTDYRMLGGNPVQKIALLKLLLAIAQAAHTPEDDDDWAELGSAGMARQCLDYLDNWHDRFWLYGERPFLQLPAVIKAKSQSAGVLMPEIATGNSTILTDFNREQHYQDAEKALLLVVQMGFPLGGKKGDASLVLSSGYQGKSKTAKFGPSLGFQGFMHSFLVAENLQQTLWVNLITRENIEQLPQYTSGFGTPPWEEMPAGEDCPVAQKLKNSLVGRLIPLARFCLLGETEIHITEGIAHQNYAEGKSDLTITVTSPNEKKPQAKWINPEKRPWRDLTAILSFMHTEKSKFECLQIKFCLPRARMELETVGLWSAGMRVSSNAGEQYLTGTDDFVSSQVMLNNEALGETWFEFLKKEMEDLEQISDFLYSATRAYAKEMKKEGAAEAAHATNLFWQLCERKFQDLVDACQETGSEQPKLLSLRKTFAAFIQQAYEHYCPKETSRQIDAWAKHRPNLSKYLTR